jgi:Arylsulfotransferase (ASST)/Secretion system C-terminal sorting domain
MKSLTPVKYILVILFTTITLLGNAQQWPGITLLASSQKDSLILVDTNGTRVKAIKCIGGNNVYSAYMQKGGFFYRTCKPATAGLNGGGMHGRIQKYDWNGTLLWDYTNASTTFNLHHDFCVLPNGNVLVICYEVKPAGSITAAGGIFASAAWFENIMEIQPTGLNTQNIVWEWKMWDHIAQNTDISKPNYVTSIIDNPQLFDITKVLAKDQFHMNGIDYDSVNNQVIFSCHFLNELFVIDHSTTTTQAATHTGGNSGKGGDFLYRYGRPTNYSATGANAIDVLHDAHIVKGGPLKGMIGFFHNKGVSSSQSTGDYISLPRSGSGFTVTASSAYTPTTFSVRKIPVGIYTSNEGSVEEYPNGNHLFCAALSGVIKEIDSNNNTIWTYNVGSKMAQAHRYQECELSVSKPSTPVVSQAGTTYSVPTTATYQYEWTTNGTVVGTTNTFSPTAFGMYYVVVKDSFGCASEKAAVGYFPAAINNVNFLPCKIYPNPAQNFIQIEMDLVSAKNVNIDIIAIDGKTVKHIAFINKVDISNIAAGNYIVKISNANQLLAEQKLVIDK